VTDGSVLEESRKFLLRRLVERHPKLHRSGRDDVAFYKSREIDLWLAEEAFRESIEGLVVAILVETRPIVVWRQASESDNGHDREDNGCQYDRNSSHLRPNVWALSCRAGWPGGSEHPVQCQTLPNLDWKTLWPGQLQCLVRWLVAWRVPLPG
jgi:hypothetical protein